MARRDLIGAVVRKPITLLETINNSSSFCREQEACFDGAREFSNRMDLHDFVIDRVGNEQVAYLEFGVWRGATFFKWLERHTSPDSRFAGFDTFTGLPEDWTPEDPAGTFSTNGETPPLDDARAQFVVGLFQSTLEPYLAANPPRGKIVLHIDCDLYSSTLFALCSMDRFLRPGSIILFDDFHSLNHEFRAWLDYGRAFPHEWKRLGRTTGGLQVAVELVER